ncbi:TPA: iron uptake transporter permease EfeU [Salmonella enterica subsp. enterica serovar Montevideo]
MRLIITGATTLLATFVIALREGLEAALIVGIIAAFLRKNNKNLFAMWTGVILAVLLSIVVGFGLSITEHSLPQAGQEGMEAIIGIVAVFFVTGMIVWMNTHASDMKKQLETEAAGAIGQSSEWALASMAFLAVLKEGFETAVFLLATFSVARSATQATVGAVTGLIVAVLIGWGIYAGGIRINLSRFFRFTGLFLILVAGGLIISALRSAHEAGWFNTGQVRVADLSWLLSPGTVQSAVITGMLGIPADPRLLEVTGWFCYIVIVTVLLYWPENRRPTPEKSVILLRLSSFTLLIAALSVFFLSPEPILRIPGPVPLVSTASHNNTPAGRLTLTNHDTGYKLHITFPGSNEATIVDLPATETRHHTVHGMPGSEWTVRHVADMSNMPETLTLSQLISLYGRIPVGLNPGRYPGPFKATWKGHCIIQAEMTSGVLLSAASHPGILLTLSGSGLNSPRTLNVTEKTYVAGCGWQTDTGYQQKVFLALQNMQQNLDTWHFYVYILPLFFVFLAAVLFIFSLKLSLKLRKESGGYLSADKSQHSQEKSLTLPDKKG